MATSPPAPESLPPPEERRLDTLAAQRAAIDELIGLATQRVQVFDVDLADSGWDRAARAELVAAFLRRSRNAELRHHRARHALARDVVPAAHRAAQAVRARDDDLPHRRGGAQRDGSAAHRRRAPLAASLPRRPAARVAGGRARRGRRWSCASSRSGRPASPGSAGRCWGSDGQGAPRRARSIGQFDPDAPRDFAVVLDHAAQVAAEAVLVELLAGLRVPQPAAVGVNSSPSTSGPFGSSIGWPNSSL